MKRKADNPLNPPLKAARVPSLWSSHEQRFLNIFDFYLKHSAWSMLALNFNQLDQRKELNHFLFTLDYAPFKALLAKKDVEGFQELLFSLPKKYRFITLLNKPEFLEQVIEILMMRLHAYKEMKILGVAALKRLTDMEPKDIIHQKIEETIERHVKKWPAEGALLQRAWKIAQEKNVNEDEKAPVLHPLS